MKILKDAILKKDFQKLTELIQDPKLYNHCLFAVIYYNSIDMFKRIVNYNPNIMKTKRIHSGVIIGPISYCIIKNNYEILEILLAYQTDKYEDETILLKTFAFKLNSNIITLLLTKSCACQNILEDPKLLTDLVTCCTYQVDNLDIILMHNQKIPERVVHFLCLTKSHAVLKQVLERAKHLNLLDKILSKRVILSSITAVEIAQLFDEYFDLTEHMFVRSLSAFISAEISVIEYMFNENNYALFHLDVLLRYINGDEKKYLDKFAFLMSKGATVTNIDCVKSLQLRRILTNNKEYVTISQVKEQCYCCHEDIEIGDSIVKLPCTHQFHEDCFNLWKVNCPTCRWE